MENRHGNCTGNSSDKPIRNDAKKCYSLPVLQKENEKLKHDLNVLQSAHVEKEILLTESLLKVQLLDDQNHELKGLLKAALVEKEKVEMKDASTCVTIETKNGSTSTSVINLDKETQVQMKDSIPCVTIETKNGSTSTSVINLDKETQVQMKDSIPSVAIQAENGSTSSSVVDVDIGVQGEDELFEELPYDEEADILIFEKSLSDPHLSSNMKEHLKKIGGVNISKVVNNILNSIATKNLLKKFVWDATASNSFQNFKNILSCIHSVVCSKENTQHNVNKIIQNALKNARANK